MRVFRLKILVYELRLIKRLDSYTVSSFIEDPLVKRILKEYQEKGSNAKVSISSEKVSLHCTENIDLELAFR